MICLQLLCHSFSSKTSKKNSTTRRVLSTYCETQELQNFHTLTSKNVVLQRFFFSDSFSMKNSREIANLLFADMSHLTRIWRQIRGYPQGGNTTHTNAKTARKNKILLNYRVSQFFTMFGKKSRNIYPTLIKAEYNNRLWMYNWTYEYAQAASFALKMALAGNKAGVFNPALLAANQVNGFTREGAAAKVGKAKQITKVYTLGVPMLFAKYIYPAKTPHDFPRITLKDDVNKQLGRKLRRKDQKKYRFYN
jgi:hypothetical protein